MTRWKPAVPFGWIIATAMLFVLPHTLFAFIYGHDVMTHLLWSSHFSGQQASGEPYPRWLLGLNSGFGSPTFFYYPPLPYLVTSIFHLFTGTGTAAQTWTGLGLSCMAALALSGVTAYLWLRPLAGERGALVAALLYMLTPYHLAIDVYVRFAFGEQWAFVFMPVVMHFTRKLVSGSPGGFVGLAAGTAMMLTTHLPSALFFLPLPILYSLVLPGERKALSQAGRALLALGFGAALSAVYLLPALTMQGSVSMDVMWTGNFSYDRHFLLVGSSRMKRFFVLGALLSLLASACAVLLPKDPGDRTPRRFWLGVVAGSVFMMLPLSIPVWMVLPPLQKIQFPWRFSALLCLGTVGLVGLSRLSELAALWKGGWAVRFVGCAFYAVVGVFLVQDIQIGLKYLDSEVRPLTRTKDRPEYRPRWSESFDSLAGGNARVAVGARLVGTEAPVEVLSWAPRHVSLKYSSPAEDWLVVDQFYYPGWTARLQGSESLLVLEPSSSDGLVRIRVPQGAGQLDVRLAPGPAERAGRWISGLSVLALAGLIVGGRLRRRQGLPEVAPPAPAVSVEEPVPVLALGGREDFLKRLGSRIHQAAMRFGSALLHSRSPAVPAVVLTVHLIVAILTNGRILRDFPNSADEYSYLVMAQTFAEGQLSVPSPEPRDFFSFIHIVNDGKYYGKYEPGWPLLLAPGVFLGVPWLVNPLLCVMALAVMYGIARRHFSIEVANLSLYLSLFNPFLAFNSASYFGHPACLLFVTVYLGAHLAWQKDPASTAAPLVAGAAAGIAFLVRPFTAVVVVGPTLIYLAVQYVRTGRLVPLLRAGILMAAPLAACVAFNFLYNYLQTGNAWTSPRIKYAEIDRPFFALSQLGGRMSTHLVDRVLAHMLWLPLAPVFLLLYAGIRSTREKREGWILLAVPVLLLVAHFFYSGRGGNRYGPRHLYEATAGILILSAAVIQSLGRPGLLMLLAVLLMNVNEFAKDARFYSTLVNERMDVFDLASRQKLTDAVVFLKSGTPSMPRADLTRNGIRFDSPVLYVLDKGSENKLLLERYPGRKAYVYSFDRAAGRGTLKPYDEDP